MSRIRGDPPFVRRMLEIVKGELCYIIGTVYIDMLLKPNVLEDIARDRSIPAPPPRPKICSPDDIITLEDESGRVTLVGERLKSAQLVTGVVIAALGMETSGGEFEVIDVCFAGMAPQLGMDRSWGDVRNMKKPEDDSMDVDTVSEATQEEWIALVSGLDVGAPSSGDAQIQMLVEYLTGEAGDASDQAGAARISRLVIAGNSLSASAMSNGNHEDDNNKDKKSYTTIAVMDGGTKIAGLCSSLRQSVHEILVHYLAQLFPKPGHDDLLVPVAIWKEHAHAMRNAG